MDILKVLNLCLSDKSNSSKKSKSKEKPANVIDRVIKENKETFDELAKY